MPTLLIRTHPVAEFTGLAVAAAYRQAAVKSIDGR
jgi:hypothetical protein